MSPMALLARSTRSRWALARALACLGALLLVAVNWLPWASVTIAVSNGGLGEVFTEALPGWVVPVLLPARLLSRLGRQQAIAIDGWLSIVWEALLFSGILLALALWQRSSARLALWMRRIFRFWLIALTLLVLLGAWVLLHVTEWIGGNNGVQVVRSELDTGLWLALVALVLFWAGAYLLMGEPRLAERAGLRAAIRTWRRSRSQLAGLAGLTVGVVLWGLGYIALPWATVNCVAPRLSLTHYVNGYCAGLDSGDTLMAFVAPHLSASTSITLFAQNILLLAFVLLSGAALLLLAGAGRHTYTRSFCGWVLAWLLAATGMALLSYRGVSSVVANPPYFAGGAWHGDLGIVLTLAGLLCAWISLIPLEAAGLAQATARAREDAPTLAMRAAEPAVEP